MLGSFDTKHVKLCPQMLSFFQQASKSLLSFAELQKCFTCTYANDVGFRAYHLLLKLLVSKEFLCERWFIWMIRWFWTVQFFCLIGAGFISSSKEFSIVNWPPHMLALDVHSEAFLLGKSLFFRKKITNHCFEKFQHEWLAFI